MSQRQPAIVFIFITLFLDIFGIGLIVPVLPGLVEKMVGGNEETTSHMVGWLVALYALMQFLFSPVLGSLSDRFGRRPVILLSLLGSGLDYLLLAWAPSLWWLFLGRIISGITAANFTAASAYIADITPPEKRAHGFGIIGAAFGLGFIAGPAVGGLVSEYGRHLMGDYGLRLPFILAAGVTLLNWVYGVFVLPESLTKENRRPFHWESAHPIKSIKSLSRWPVVLSLSGVHFLMNLTHTIYPSLWVLYTKKRYGWGELDVGLSLGFVGIMSAIVQGGLAGRIIGFLGDRRGLLLGFALMTVAMVGYGLAPNGFVIYVVMFVGAFSGIAGPAAQAIITKKVGATEQGEVQGALNSVASVAGIVGPIVWTWMFAYSVSDERKIHVPGIAFIVAGILTFGAMLLGRWALRGEKIGAAKALETPFPLRDDPPA
ncbi:TCR/Tet family MFS transporter [Roseimicrobium gellanilyticum]|nr:TCR/Tet family MFS transporter [Roseimicrobium gellanilyticum]